VVDDYAPCGLGAHEMEAKAERVLRSQGNLAGRARLRSDLSEHAGFPPRGLLISTGEQHPSGQSILARLLVIEMDRNDVNLTLLSQGQERAGRLPHAMAGYIEWIAPQRLALPALLRETFEGMRPRTTAGLQHGRVPEMLAHLYLGINSALLYAEEIGACSSSEAEDLREHGWTALVDLGRSQDNVVEGERPSRRFVTVLETIVTQGRGILLPRTEPPGEAINGVELLGWQDDHGLYLIPEAAWKAVVSFCQACGEPFPVKEDRLRRDLAREQLMDCDDRRFTKMVRTGGELRRVLSLKRQELETLLGHPFYTPFPVVSGVSTR